MESGGYIGVSHHLTRPHSSSHQRSIKQQVVLEPVGLGSFPPSASDIRGKRYNRNYVADTPIQKKLGLEALALVESIPRYEEYHGEQRSDCRHAPENLHGLPFALTT